MLAVIAIVFLCGIPANASQCAEHDFRWISEQPDCSTPGYQGYQCSVCFQTWQMESIPELGHSYSGWRIIAQASCSSAGIRERTCGRCGYVQDQAIDALAHSYVSTVKAPTCRTDGYTALHCTVCGYETKTDRVEAPGHKYVVTVHSPECTEQGYTSYRCRVCGDWFYTDYTEPTGHVYDTGVLTRTPTNNSGGTVTYTCLRCDEAYTEPTPAWDGSFGDISQTDYYFPAVLWAVDQEITEGVCEACFGPDEICTRAQVVTFLWRQAGEPRPKNGENPFCDVCSGDYFYQAVLWAAEKGIAKGVDDTHFAPGGSCTRCQVMTFLYRAKGFHMANQPIGFTDVKAGDYFYDAVRWASQERITVGTDKTKFSPHEACTRAQIVTFLFRAKDL